jgi:hypothetical protein
MLFEIVVGTNLEPPKYLSISPLYLAIASRVCPRSEAELDADVLAALLKVPALELVPLSVMIQFGTPNRHTIDLRNAIADALVMLTIGVASGHLVNLSMATYRYWYQPTALGKGPKISNPHTAKGQEGGIIYRA